MSMERRKNEERKFHVEKAVWEGPPLAIVGWDADCQTPTAIGNEEKVCNYIPMNIHVMKQCVGFVLKGWSDDTGKPLIGDCTCQGNDAGFAQISCIIKYIQRKRVLKPKTRMILLLHGHNVPTACGFITMTLQSIYQLHFLYTMECYGYTGNDDLND